LTPSQPNDCAEKPQNASIFAILHLPAAFSILRTVSRLFAENRDLACTKTGDSGSSRPQFAVNESRKVEEIHSIESLRF